MLTALVRRLLVSKNHTTLEFSDTCSGQQWRGFHYILLVAISYFLLQDAVKLFRFRESELLNKLATITIET